MFEIKGKYGSAVVYTDVIEETAVSQIQTLCNQNSSAGSRIRIMPDVHAGAGCTIGTTMTITDKIIPNLVGVDIGCAIDTVRLRERDLDFAALDRLIYAAVPSGCEVRGKAHRFAAEIDLSQLYCFPHLRMSRIMESIGSLGGGNHFIEIDRGDDGTLYLVVHSGSRNLGVQVATYYQNEAYARLNGTSAEDVAALIAGMKAAGRTKEIQTELNKLRNIKNTAVPKELAYTEGSLFDAYIHDMKIVQHFAVLNRRAIVDEIVTGLGLHVDDFFPTIHNYIDTEHMILRKGAVSAHAGEMLLIPINMRDGSLICVGKGNDEWNQSAPHGAGRLFSRAAAKRTFTVEDFRETMAGIYSTSISESTLDECPMAYKSMEDIVSNIGDTAEIREVIRPVFNFKAGEQS